jgi:single-stranded-DNA-specific exonuclease
MSFSAHYDNMLDELLRKRGVDAAEREVFLNPDFGRLHDPLLLPNMAMARDRVLEAITKNEHIVIFSDYDADGIPGAVVLSDFFTRIKYDNVSFYIPHRHDEGFGLSTDAIDEAKKRGASLLITIDCGVADVEEVAHANSLGIDCVITDHHLEADTLPSAYAIVNPNLKQSEYPFKEICGAAVAFKLVQALYAKERFGTKEGIEKWSLDMVGIATLSDMVPLVGENRILAKFGLEVLRKSPRPGLQALFKKLGMDQRFISEDDIAFMITPRINAASRMGVPMDAFNLLSTTSLLEAARLADHLEKINNERKTTVATLVKDAKKHMAAREVREVIVIGNPEWRPALLGLVANSLVEEYERPCFVWGRDGDGVIKGSCRSYNGYNLFDLMSAAADSFMEFGGHAGAGGFSVSMEKISTLEEKLSTALADLSNDGDAEESDNVVAIEIHEVGEDLWKVISQLAPFGTGNPKPVFTIAGVEVSNVRQFGKTGDHLEILIANPKGREVKAISFFSTPSSFSVAPKVAGRATVHAHLEKSYFRNRPELRLRIVDIK